MILQLLTISIYRIAKSLEIATACSTELPEYRHDYARDNGTTFNFLKVRSIVDHYLLHTVSLTSLCRLLPGASSYFGCRPQKSQVDNIGSNM